MARCEHDVVAGRKPGTERCRKCSWTFPCREETCSHFECIDFRGKLPKCYYCLGRVVGSPGGRSSATAVLEVLRVSGGDSASWTPWSVRNISRAVHYCCREAVASLEERKRWGTENETVNCKHEFDGKGVVGQDASQQVHEDQEAIA
jgi:hypothetical protein